MSTLTKIAPSKAIIYEIPGVKKVVRRSLDDVPTAKDYHEVHEIISDFCIGHLEIPRCNSLRELQMWQKRAIGFYVLRYTQTNRCCTSSTKGRDSHDTRRSIPIG